MRWPWARNASVDQLVFSWSANKLTFVLARPKAFGDFDILKFGVLLQEGEGCDKLALQLQQRGLQGYQATAMLRPEQYQFLQIAAPAVPPEELKAAARYQIREMLDTHIDDITLDVLQVGDARKKANPQLFVVAAANTAIRQTLALADAMEWPITVIDILETAQRNLQCIKTQGNALRNRASALLMFTSQNQAVLTISAKDELYYARRLDVADGLMGMKFGNSSDGVPDAFASVGASTPDYQGNDLGSTDYNAPIAPASGQSADGDRAQRFLLEVQRTLDSWDRTWTDLPLAGLQVYAAERSLDLSAWLSQGLGQVITVLDTQRLFSGLETASAQEQTACLPLLGVLLRNSDRPN